VAEAAVPRFVNRNGQQINGRNWGLNDMMVDSDEDYTIYLLGAESLKDQTLPISGTRDNLDSPAL
jgi:hypothetical protein